MSDTQRNWIDLKLTKDDDETVAKGAAAYKTAHQGDLETVFSIARAIGVLKDANYGGGDQGAYASALIQYGFTNRSGDKELAASIRAELETMLDHEEAVRSWWNRVPEKKRFGWCSARTIYRHWQRSMTAPESEAKAPRKPSAASVLRQQNDGLTHEVEDLKERLAAAETGAVGRVSFPGMLEPEQISAENIVAAFIEPSITPPEKALAVAEGIFAELGGVARRATEDETVRSVPEVTYTVEKALERLSLGEQLDKLRGVMRDRCGNPCRWTDTLGEKQEAKREHAYMELMKFLDELCRLAKREREPMAMTAAALNEKHAKDAAETRAYRRERDKVRRAAKAKAEAAKAKAEAPKPEARVKRITKTASVLVDDGVAVPLVTGTVEAESTIEAGETTS